VLKSTGLEAATCLPYEAMHARDASTLDCREYRVNMCWMLFEVSGGMLAAGGSSPH